MSISVEPEADLDPAPARDRRRWLLWSLLALIAVSLLLAGFGFWLATGLKSAAAAVKAPAADARANLATMKTALQAGDQAAAKVALAAAHGNIEAAKKAAGTSQVSIASKLPVLNEPVADLRHLLTAASDLVDGADRVVALYDDVSGADSKLFRDSAFDIAVIRESEDSVQQLLMLLDKAEAELGQVRGGRFAEGAAEARDAGLEQIKQLRVDVQPLVNILGVLPEAVGDKTKKCYLITMQNQAELRAGGGAPLTVTEMCFDKGVMSVAPPAQTVDIDGSGKNTLLNWPAVEGNGAWHKPGKAEPFVNANFAPHWPTTGEELLRAYEVFAGSRVDGVIGMDVTAMAAVLRVAGGSITATGYGTVTGDNLAQTILIDAYRKFDHEKRRAYNAELMTQVVAKMSGGGQLAGKIRALTGTARGRHMQMYMRDPELAKLIEPTAMAGRLDPGRGDFAAFYTTNTNASKVDVYQARSMTQDVVIDADLSARVTRTVKITNNSPGYRASATYPRDPSFGYATTFSKPILATYVPPGARVRGFTVTPSERARANLRPYANDRGMRVLFAYAHLPRGHSVTSELVYLTRPNTHVDGYRLRIASQSTLQPMELVVRVKVPPGYVVNPTPGWELQGDTWTASVQIGQDVDILLPFARG